VQVAGKTIEQSPVMNPFEGNTNEQAPPYALSFIVRGYILVLSIRIERISASGSDMLSNF
jgi:hypothetical protein